MGTSTVALNLAVALSRQNRRTIAVELRPDYGVFSFQLKHEPANTIAAFQDVDLARIDIEAVESRLANFPLGLRILFGPQRPEEFRLIPSENIEALLRVLSGMAECIVIDLAPVICPMTQAALRHCHFVSIVVEREPMCAQAGRVLQETLQAWDIHNEVRGAIVVSKFAMTSAASGNYELAPNDVASAMECPIVGVIPPAGDLCARANHAGIPILVLEPESLFSTTIQDMAQRVMAETAAPIEGEGSRARSQRDLENWFW